tara:strand:- start:531 stop:1406 length:876 start_codon:yes stop_codon:yes gene_type:complete
MISSNNNNGIKIKLKININNTMQKSGLNRNTLDKFYTKSTLVDSCFIKINELLSIDKNKDIIIEPSAGGGSFIESIKGICINYQFYDIAPEHSDIIKKDYLTTDLSKYSRKIHVIGNPPFGRQSSLAIKFIRHSCKYCESISFILPKSFKKDSLKKRFPLNFHCIHESDVPVNSFEINKIDHNVPCIFQIWIKRDFNREVPVILKPNGYKFVKKTENHDISFRRVGVNAGNISMDTDDKSEQSHYFIKFDKELNDSFIKKIKSISFLKSSDTVGPKSISKQELIKEFSEIL